MHASMVQVGKVFKKQKGKQLNCFIKTNKLHHNNSDEIKTLSRTKQWIFIDNEGMIQDDKCSWIEF